MSAPREQALRLLQRVVGDAADFRPRQWEAIEALVDRRARLLLVQATGWGKSIVYFLTTRILRDQGAGPTLLVSPLLALMRNQIVAATRLSLNAVSINSTNRDEWAKIAGRLRKNAVDVLLISPERVANERFQQEILIPLAQKAGLFVVDEAHCISDWGHDFRPDYSRIVSVLQQLPANIPVCATTATANHRVVATRTQS
jgi:ATP-dependent DNA helicase RecQ